MKKKTTKAKEPEAPVSLKYDFGCGQNKQEGYIGVDYVKTPQTDIVHDLTKFPYSFAKDNSADEIFTSHFIEHLTGEDFIKFMDECYRILKVGGKCVFIAPYYNSIRCWQDPTHKQAISEAKFLYFNKGWRDANKLDHYHIKSNFDFTYGYNFSPAWASRNEEARQFAIANYTNVINDIYVTLTKI